MRYTSSVILHKKDDIEAVKKQMLNDFIDKCLNQHIMPPKNPHITFNLNVSITWEDEEK